MIAQTTTLNLAGDIVHVRINNGKPEVKTREGDWITFEFIALKCGHNVSASDVLKMIIGKTV